MSQDALDTARARLAIANQRIAMGRRGEPATLLADEVAYAITLASTMGFARREEVLWRLWRVLAEQTSLLAAEAGPSCAETVERLARGRSDDDHAITATAE